MSLVRVDLLCLHALRPSHFRPAYPSPFMLFPAAVNTFPCIIQALEATRWPKTLCELFSMHETNSHCCLPTSLYAPLGKASIFSFFLSSFLRERERERERESVMDSRSLWCITTGVWSDTKRVKTLAFSSMKKTSLECEHDVFTTEHWTIRWIGDPFWFLWQYQIEISSA